jgi:hypothetical protein
MKTMYRATARQMELGLPQPATLRHHPRRQRRLPGAHWWFQQMRQAVLNTPSGLPATPELQVSSPLSGGGSGMDPSQS